MGHLLTRVDISTHSLKWGSFIPTSWRPGFRKLLELAAMVPESVATIIRISHMQREYPGIQFFDPKVGPNSFDAY